MKIAIPSKGTDLDSEINPRLRNAPYTLIVDTFGLGVDVLDHSWDEKLSKETLKQAVSVISKKGASALLTGICSPNEFKSFSAAGLKVANNISGTVREAVIGFIEGRITFTDVVDLDRYE